jgi:hypothetical protein
VPQARSRQSCRSRDWPAARVRLRCPAELLVRYIRDIKTILAEECHVLSMRPTTSKYNSTGYRVFDSSSLGIGFAFSINLVNQLQDHADTILAAELCVNRPQMAPNGHLAHAKGLGHVVIAQPATNQAQNAKLRGCQLVSGSGFRPLLLTKQFRKAIGICSSHRLQTPLSPLCTGSLNTQGVCITSPSLSPSGGAGISGAQNNFFFYMERNGPTCGGHQGMPLSDDR